jgi:hypothetical protein
VYACLKTFMTCYVSCIAYLSHSRQTNSGRGSITLGILLLYRHPQDSPYQCVFSYFSHSLILKLVAKLKTFRPKIFQINYLPCACCKSGFVTVKLLVALSEKRVQKHTRSWLVTPLLSRLRHTAAFFWIKAATPSFLC